ncbi:MAG: DUF1877 family protein [Propionicimonas sp.]
MGMQAVYLAVDEPTLDRLVAADPADLVELIEELEEADTPKFSMDKLWDGLHFLLTGASAASPIEGDPLSEAVVGVHIFPGDDFVGCTELDELPRIVERLDALDLDALLNGADFATFDRADVYPRIWTDDPAALAAELSEAFVGLRAFHHRCVADGKHLIVSIY